MVEVMTEFKISIGFEQSEGGVEAVEVQNK